MDVGSAGHRAMKIDVTKNILEEKTREGGRK